MMNWMQFGVETTATAIEVWIILSTVTEIAESKYTGWSKFMRLTISTFGLTVFVSILNVFDLFSFVTIVLSVLAAMLITRFITKQSARFRLFSTILVFLSMLFCNWRNDTFDFIYRVNLSRHGESPLWDFSIAKKPIASSTILPHHSSHFTRSVNETLVAALKESSAVTHPTTNSKSRIPTAGKDIAETFTSNICASSA